MIGVLMIAFFVVHSAHIALGQETAAKYMPISCWIANTFISGASTAGTGYGS